MHVCGPCTGEARTGSQPWSQSQFVLGYTRLPRDREGKREEKMRVHLGDSVIRAEPMNAIKILGKKIQGSEVQLRSKSKRSLLCAKPWAQSPSHRNRSKQQSQSASLPLQSHEDSKDSQPSVNLEAILTRHQTGVLILDFPASRL